MIRIEKNTDGLRIDLAVHLLQYWLVHEDSYNLIQLFVL